jgi:hypothetical protein
VEIVLEVCLCVPLDSAVPAWCVGAKVFATNRSLPMAPALCMGRVAGHRPSPTRECASARLLRGCSASAHQSAESPQGKQQGSGLENDLAGAHIYGMDQILPPELSALEFDALRQIAAHPASCHIPPNVQSRLRDIGYLKEVLGGIVVTADGLQRIAMEKR